MHSKKMGQQVLHQEIALDSYLSTLLDEIPTDVGLNQAEESLIKSNEIEKSELTLEATPKPKQRKVVKKQVQQLNSKALSEKLLNPISVMPDWAQHEFQALFFKVDQLILATPLTSLLRTIKVEKKPTPIPGQPSWFLGLLDIQDHRVGVLDMGQLVFGKKKGQQRNLEQNPFKSILITADGKWGLACDEVLSIAKLEPEKVRWRTLRQKRAWLLGTVIEELTAVIDIDKLVPHRKNK